MHEMSLCEGMIQIIQDHARAHAFKQVDAVNVEIGALSDVEPEALSFCFDLVAKGTIADGAVLKIHHPPGLAWCMDCSAQVEIRQRHDDCPECGGRKLQVIGGDQMRITDLEVN